MIAMNYVGKYSGMFESVLHISGHQVVINSPAQILASRAGPIAPPAVLVRVLVKMPKGIYEAAIDEILHPFAFFGQKSAGICVRFWVMDIDSFMANIIIAA